ncbi:alpha/beta fold hydrolase [Pseudomonas sp. 1176_21]|uniref:alpha/beta fold hydrolase n=1 Tax=Pseudomonas sp. 1176_21 TaxID=2604453 RepID=UPI004063D03E
MAALADNGYQAIAVDLPGMGLSDKPLDGYDTGTCAARLHALMGQLGHERYAVVGHDVGMWVGYALASDFSGGGEPAVPERSGDSGPGAGAVDLRAAGAEHLPVALHVQPVAGPARGADYRARSAVPEVHVREMGCAPGSGGGGYLCAGVFGAGGLAWRVCLLPRDTRNDSPEPAARAGATGHAGAGDRGATGNQ